MVSVCLVTYVHIQINLNIIPNPFAMYRKYVSLVCEKNHSQKCVSVRTYKHPIIQTKWEKVFVLPPPWLRSVNLIFFNMEFLLSSYEST